MDKAGQAFPVIARQRVRQRHVPLEVLVLAGQHVEIFYVEHFAHTTGTVPEADLALGVQALQLVEDVGAHRRHTRTTTDEHHLRIGILGEELTKRSHYGYLVTRLQVEDEGRHDARRMISARRRRSEEHTSELQSRPHLVCRLLLEKKKKKKKNT